MKKLYAVSLCVLSFLLLLFPFPTFALTAEEVIQKAATNLEGPVGTTIVADGKMQFSRRNLDIRVARYWHDGTEGFQIDILSPMEDKEVPDATPQTNKKYRVVRKAMDISTLTYLPSLRRGRKINYVPLDGVLGSEYPYYLLPLASDFLHDFSYTFVKEDINAPVIKGVQIAESRSPYAQVQIELQKREATYTIEKAIYETPNSRGLTFLLQEFIEFAPGYWAPKKVMANDTVFTFDTWRISEPLEWLHSTNHNVFDAQGIPQVRNKQ
ncbi:MAG: hypothetical protein HY268_34040 [Deltaproteobacteria bacterium]|nr:hypothetical protein [Deltaproteobacteria bacterium]